MKKEFFEPGFQVFMASLLATLGSKFHFYGINKRPGRLPSYRQPNEGRTIVFRREKPKPCEKFCLKVSKISSRRYKKAFWYRALAMLSFLFSLCSSKLWLLLLCFSYVTKPKSATQPKLHTYSKAGYTIPSSYFFTCMIAI